ncbi:MAG TPA: 5-formyltetrahydrofolate cyclo-ligase [Microbacteriaceae bacterium]|nr:5-formyltetrahydrofolate cyclo-ligase [Microbacteriaceae bacterium]
MAEKIDLAKQALRRRIKSERHARTDSQREELGAQLSEQLQMLVIARGARSISCYFPVEGEPNTITFMLWALANDIEVLLPKSRTDGLLDWVEYDGGDLDPGLFGIPEPDGEALSPISVNDVDLMLVPASAVDKQGNRLGWGRGYFDKSLGSMEQRPHIFAIVHDSEIFDEVPTDVHDIPVDGAVTPTQIVHFHDD